MLAARGRVAEHEFQTIQPRHFQVSQEDAVAILGIGQRLQRLAAIADRFHDHAFVFQQLLQVRPRPLVIVGDQNPARRTGQSRHDGTSMRVRYG